MPSRQLQIKHHENKGKELLPKYLEDLATRLNKDKQKIALLDIETTLNLLDKFREKMRHLQYKDSFSIKYYWPFTDISQAQNLLSYLESRMPSRPMIMYRRLSEYCGAVEIDLSELLQKSFSLVELDEEDYYAYDLQGNISILFDFYTERLEGSGHSEKIYELRLRGEEWKAILEEIPPSM